MPQYDNNMTGALFVNDKAGNPKRPDYKGNLEINGQKYELAAWVRTPRKGKCDQFLSLKVSLPYVKPGSTPPAPQQPTGATPPPPLTPPPPMPPKPEEGYFGPKPRQPQPPPDDYIPEPTLLDPGEPPQ